ncbi:unnamed protein product [Withania somnifera]
MEAPAAQPTTPRKKMTKQLTGKRGDSALHSAARAGNLVAIKNTIENTEQEELAELLIKQNSAGETPLYVAAEYGYYEVVREMIIYYDLIAAGIKARNGFDALHIASKQGDLDVVKVLMEAHPQLAMTVDVVNTTALHTAANQGHIEIVNYLLEEQSSLATIAKSNGKTALHSSARNGHLQVLKALLGKEPGIAMRMDNKGQTALHMAAKGQNVEIVEELFKADPSLVHMVDNKGNTPLHIAARKGRFEIVKFILSQKETDTKVINRSHETALDSAEKMSHADTIAILKDYGVQSARVLKPQATNPGRELKQTVSDIKHEVNDQLKHTKQTRKRIQGIAKRLHKMHREGLNNAINSTTVVAVLIATVAFAGIFQGHIIGEANISNHPGFLVFFIFDSIALFISLAVVVVQTTVVVIESKAKKKLMSIINKLMWIACVFVSVAYLALSFVVVGTRYRLMAILVTVLGATIMASTIGVLLYWVITHRIDSSNKKNMRKNSLATKSAEWSDSAISDENNEFKIYAL